MIPSASSASISDRVSPSSPRSSSLCSPRSGACRSCSRSGPRENLIGKRAVAGASDHRMVHLFEEVAGRELREVGLAVGLHDLADGHTGVPQAFDDLVGRPGPAPLLQERVDPVLLPDPSRRGRQRGVGRPLRFTQRTAEGLPLLVGRDGDRDPAVVAAVLVGSGDLIEVLRRRSRARGCRRGPAAPRRRRTRSPAPRRR